MLKRNEVPENLTWDITQLYKNVDEYKKDLEKAEKMSENLYAKYFKKIENSQDINNCLDDYAKYEEIVDLLNHYVYTFHDQVGTPVGQYSGVDQRDRVRVSADPAGRRHLSHEASTVAFVVQRPGVDLDGHRTPQ